MCAACSTGRILSQKSRIFGVGVKATTWKVCCPRRCRCQTRIAVHRAVSEPRLREIHRDVAVEDAAKKMLKVVGPTRVGQVVILTLHDAGGKAWRRLFGGAGGKESGVADEDTSDDGVVVAAQALTAVPADPGAHLLQAADTVVFAEKLPCLRHRQSSEATVNAAADDPVLRVMALEEERLARTDRLKRRPPAGRQKFTSSPGASA